MIKVLINNSRRMLIQKLRFPQLFNLYARLKVCSPLVPAAWQYSKSMQILKRKLKFALIHRNFLKYRHDFKIVSWKIEEIKELMFLYRQHTCFRLCHKIRPNRNGATEVVWFMVYIIWFGNQIT